jgi:NAD(P)-dependent dehydrogenase (short-subunit alcohol dehydrogenase family)
MSGSDKVALITGAGTGVGRAVALALSKIGFAIVLAGRRQEPLDTTSGEIKAAGGKALGVSADVGDPQSVQALFARAKQEFGRLDLLFNNAGTGAPAVPMEELTFEQWKSVVDANLTGMFLCTQEATKIMKAQTPMGGRIVNNGSISAYAPRPNSIAYTATKHAVSGMTKSTSLDGRKYDIACSQIDIGNANTAMGGRMSAGVPQADGSIKPEPVFDPAHVGSAIAFIASLPLDVNVQFMTIMATKMPFVGRG